MGNQVRGIPDHSVYGQVCLAEVSRVLCESKLEGPLAVLPFNPIGRVPMVGAAESSRSVEALYAHPSAWALPAGSEIGSACTPGHRDTGG